MAYVVGLTGGIASGKSTVANLIKTKHGFVVIDCDVLGHRAYAPGGKCFGQVVTTFGADVVLRDGTIDRKILSEKVFGNPAELRKLTDIVWSEIRRLLSEELARCSSGTVCFVEAAVLLEAGWRSMCNEVMVR